MFLKNTLSYLFHYFFGSYRDYDVEQIETNPRDTTTLHVRSLSGVIINFYCTKYNYIIKNNHPFIPDYKYSVYKLYGTCVDKCPEKLVLVLENIAYFPTLKPFFTDEEKRRKFLIETYISLLNTQLKSMIK